MEMGLNLSVEELQARLPQPYLPARPELTALYWRSWELGARMVRHGTAANGFSPTYVDAAFGGNIFQWDTCFIAAFARYSRELLPILPALDNFYRLQEPDGYMAREYRWENGAPLWAKRSGNSINPPLYSWAEWQVYQLTADQARLATVWPHLDGYYRYLQHWHRNPDGTYWITDMGSGMDNTPRYGAGWVDLTCQQALNAQTMSRIASAIGNPLAAEWYRAEHHSLSQVINARLWNEGDGFYWDVDTMGLAVKNKTVASFWALLAEVTTPAQAARLVAHLQDPATFWRAHPFPTLAADHWLFKPHGDYWLGSVWAPTNYMIIKGLTATGHHEFARTAALQHLAAIERVATSTGTVWENYRPDEDAPGVPARPDFVGWTGCSPIALLLETVLGFEVAAPRQAVQWRIHEAGPHGVRALPVGAGTVDILIDAERTVSVTTAQPLTLEISGARGTHTLQFAPGTHEETLP